MNKTPSFAADASHWPLGDKQRNPDPNWLLGVLFSDKNTDGSSNLFCQTNKMLAAVQMFKILAAVQNLCHFEKTHESFVSYHTRCNLKYCWITELRKQYHCYAADLLLSLQESVFSMFGPGVFWLRKYRTCQGGMLTFEFTFLLDLTLKLRETYELQRAPVHQQVMTVASWSPHYFIERQGWAGFAVES